jgi:hypothetical protein
MVASMMVYGSSKASSKQQVASKCYIYSWLALFCFLATSYVLVVQVESSSQHLLDTTTY